MADAWLYAVARHAERMMCEAITTWLARYSRGPKACKRAARATWEAAFGNQRRLECDLAGAISGLDDLVRRHVQRVVADEDAGAEATGCIRLLKLMGKANPCYALVKKLALATLFPDGSVDNRNWYKTMKAWAYFGGFRGAHQHPSVPFQPDLAALRRCVTHVSFERSVTHQGETLSAGGDEVRHVFLRILDLIAMRM